MDLLIMLGVSLAINAFFFIFAAWTKTDYFTDITYSLGFILLSVYIYITQEPEDIISHILLAMVILWALRLGSYLFYRIIHIKTDHRFDERRNSVVRFGLFWLLQAVTTWVVMLPVFGIVSSGPDIERVPVTHIMPFSVSYLAGLAIETAADIQKYRFIMNPAGRNRFVNTGIWRYSRHPNYFGEIVIWWSIGLPGIFVFSGVQWLYLSGPIAITLLLIFVSGIPLLEKSADEKWGNDPEYTEYKSTTSILIPLPVKHKRL